jgi:hypothetical protein
MQRNPFHFLVVLALSTALALTACGPATITKEQAQTGAMAALTASVGMPSPQITCPADMPAVVGATQVCSMPVNGATFDVTITITSVEGTNAKFSVVVASTPRP